MLREGSWRNGREEGRGGGGGGVRDGRGEKEVWGEVGGGGGEVVHGWLVVMYSCLQSISMQGWTEIHRPEDGEREREEMVYKG